MTFYRYLQQAAINLKSSTLRSTLAVIGILVGTAAVVALLSCGQLATETALQEFKSLGTNLLAVNLFQVDDGTSSASQNAPLTNTMWQQIQNRIPSLENIAPFGTAFQSLSFAGHELQASIIGADERLANIINIQMAEGYFVSFVDSFEHYCVVGAESATLLQQYTAAPLLHQQLKIGAHLYTIIGIAKPWQENSFFNDNINQSIIIPLGGLALIEKEPRLNNALMRLKPHSSVDDILAEIKQMIKSHAPQLRVFARSAKQIIASMESQQRIFTVLLAVIGSISLIVGGVGVMNIMLVSVSERKKEIGIRKAVGAKNKEIQTLFLMEAVLLALLGGSAGVAVGLLITWIMAYFNNWTFIFYPIPPCIGFIVSAITGIFFGFYPAHRASQLEPMVALRSI